MSSFGRDICRDRRATAGAEDVKFLFIDRAPVQELEILRTGIKRTL
jgi:hypothetical protein